MARTRVMVVDDDDFTRSMLVTTLQMQDFDVVVESGSAAVAIKAAQMLKPDIALLDLDLGLGPNGIDLALALRRALPKIGIVMLTTFEDPRLLSPNMPMLPVGSIYLIKKETSKIDRLSNAIEEAISNANNLTKRDKLVMPPKSELTDNQIEIMRLVANGHSNMQIAKMRGINEKSVEQTISRLAKELSLKSELDKNLRVQISRLYYQMTGAGPTKHAK